MTRRVPRIRMAASLAAALAVTLVSLLTGCAVAVQEPQPAASAAIGAHPGLDATLWVQTSAEYHAAAVQAYRLAELMLAGGLEDRRWTADLEQQAAGGYAHLPPAVILDLDETVLDNSPHQARLILDRKEFDTRGWQDWVREQKTRAVPGALQFVRAAEAAGVRVFYVTNRRHEVEAATRANLEALGFPVSTDPDTLLTRDERRQWGAEKGSRRSHVAAQHRVLLLVGDDYGDFAAGLDVSVDERRARAASHGDLWGSRWIVLPNPQYGSWDAALIGFRHELPLEEKLRIKSEALDPVR